MSLTPYWEKRLHQAVMHFWSTRGTQTIRQGAKSGARDAGNRTAVTGGKQLDGFVELVRDYLIECGIEKGDIFCNQKVELPGWFRAEKKWDLLVVVSGQLVAAMEFKSQVGSFGNNFNNRTEEVLGSATDIWAAYREGAFSPSQRPWLGYLMVLEETHKSLQPVTVQKPHFSVFPEFDGASYAKRYEILMTKLVRERLYDNAALLLSPSDAAKDGGYLQPSAELDFNNFLTSLKARVSTVAGASK
uniref:Type II restriction enzyme BstVI (Endonuclease BstVI) (R.BstVI) n=1 Tax=mine drainage metagenome TaxID=410659 RepID=E6QII0_9ZZZZ